MNWQKCTYDEILEHLAIEYSINDEKFNNYIFKYVSSLRTRTHVALLLSLAKKLERIRNDVNHAN